jgi:hydrogenase maturation factor
MAVAESQAGSLLTDLQRSGHPEATIIGNVEQKREVSLVMIK